MNSGVDGGEFGAQAQSAKKFHDDMIVGVGKVLVGMHDTVSLAVMALLANGHILLEGVPGVAKTTLSKVLAGLLGLDSQRIQFTPDLMPQDVTGATVPDRKSGDWILRKGPVFTNILLADEINRASAKTQSALLEAMQERQVSIEGQSLPLPQPFLVMATQNPIEQEGVYRLPEAQLDRFLVRIRLDYPGRAKEIEMLSLVRGETEIPKPIANAVKIGAWQALVDQVVARNVVLEYVVDLARATREHPMALLGASPRAALAVLRMARSRALCQGRSHVTHEDIQAVAKTVLSHRLIARPEAELDGWSGEAIIAEVLASVPVIQA